MLATESLPTTSVAELTPNGIKPFRIDVSSSNFIAQHIVCDAKRVASIPGTDHVVVIFSSAPLTPRTMCVCSLWNILVNDFGFRKGQCGVAPTCECDGDEWLEDTDVGE